MKFHLCAFAIFCVFFPIAGHAKEDPVCKAILPHLLPEKISSGVSEGVEKNLDGVSYVSHYFKYTDFCVDCSRDRYVLGSGFALYEANGRLSLGQSDLFLSEYGYFVDGAWKESQRFSNVGRSTSAQTDPSIKAMSVALFYLEYGKKADDFYRVTDGGKSIIQHLPRYGIRGSDIRYWYECQSCRKGVPEFTYSLSQDLRYTRIASLGQGLALVTTRPRVVVAVLGRRGISYHECPETYRSVIESTSTIKE